MILSAIFWVEISNRDEELWYIKLFDIDIDGYSSVILFDIDNYKYSKVQNSWKYKNLKKLKKMFENNTKFWTLK